MKLFRYLVLYLLFYIQIFSQSPNGEQSEIKSFIAESNNITSLVFNYGSIGAPNMYSNIADLVWNGLGYMFEFGPMISGKVIGEENQELYITSDSYIRNFQGDYNPEGTLKWGFLPESGYSNPSNNQIANSKNPDSWPNDWTNWPGEFGNGVLIAENEVYYKMNDFSNAEFPYYPFPDDQLKRGLGVSVTVRIYQFKYGLIDALIIKYLIKNESPKNLNEVYFGYMGDPHIGGASDYGDDRVGIVGIEDIPNDKFSKALNTIYNYDSDGIGMDSRTTGFMNFSILESPDNKGLTSFHPAVYTNSLPNVPMNDPLMWEWFSSGINNTSELLTEPGDNIIHFGTGPFSLNAGEIKTVKLAIFLSNDYNDMLLDAVYINYHHNWPLITNSVADNSGNEDYKIELTAPSLFEYQNNINIEWDYIGSDLSAKVLLEYSSDLGKTWNIINSNLTATQELYNWDISNLPDGMNYIVRAISYNVSNPASQYFYSISKSRFSINKPNENAKPELTITSTFTNTVISSSVIEINWSSEDADNQNHNVKFEFFDPITQTWQEIANEVFSNGEKQFFWDISNLANGDEYKLKLTASDGNTDVIKETESFSINYFRGEFNSNIVQHSQGKAEAKINIAISNPDFLTSDTYEISFTVENEIDKKFSVKNLNSSDIILADYPLVNNYSTPSIDGIKITIKDEKTRIDSINSGFNRTELDQIVSYYTTPVYLPGNIIASDNDWNFIFNNLDTTSSGNYQFPGDTVLTTTFSSIVLPFKIENIDFASKGNVLIQETIPGLRNNGRWDFGELIILRPHDAAGIDVSYGIKLQKAISLTPQMNDTLKIITINSITENDKYLITPTNDYLLEVEDLYPYDFSLSQNFPNPFNPSTKINYSLKESGNVKLTIFDVLGRKVIDLYNGFMEKGNHSITFNASNLSSGIYLYRIESGSFVKTKKMILLK